MPSSPGTKGSSKKTAHAASRAAELRVGRVLALCEALLSERGEVSGARIAAYALSAYEALDAPARDMFFDRLAVAFDPEPQRVRRLAREYDADPSPARLARLQAAVEPPRQELFRRANQATGGTGVLIRLRQQLLRTLAAHPERAGVDADLLHLFRSWFNRGFLVLRRIDWHTPAVILERLIQYEAVHEIKGWRDLHRRLEADRRCYAFFHPVLPDEPLIFIEVALTRGMSAGVEELLDPDAPIGRVSQADCAMFYSITNCQEGLRGVSFGSFLIKQVVDDLSREFPGIRTFATISPIPGFCQWLQREAKRRAYSSRLHEALEGVAKGALPEPRDLVGDLRGEVTRLCVDYLRPARRSDTPPDPVARFHLANGAHLHRLNWMADPSPSGMTRSLGLMVNYVYRPDELERNHEVYVKNGRVITSPWFLRGLRKRAGGQRA